MPKETIAYGKRLNPAYLRNVTIAEVINIIRTGGNGVKEAQAELRRLISSKAPTEAAREHKKKNFPYFSTAKFRKNYRKDANVESASFLLLDVDKIPTSDIYKVRSFFERLKETLLCFVSPSGRGIKVLFRLAEPITDKSTFTQLYRYYVENIGERLPAGTLDAATSDLSRACFFAYDPDMFYNPDAVPLPVDFPTIQREIEKSDAPKSPTIGDLRPWMIREAEKEYNYAVTVYKNQLAGGDAARHICIRDFCAVMAAKKKANFSADVITEYAQTLNQELTEAANMAGQAKTLYTEDHIYKLVSSAIEKFRSNGKPAPAPADPAGGAAETESAAGAPGEDSTAGKAYKLTEFGNSERFLDRYRANILYNYSYKKWMIWNGYKWAMDEKGEVEKLAKKTIRGIYTEAARADNDDLRAALAKHAARSEKHSQVTNMIALAQPERGIVENELDKQPFYFNMLNGTYDLENGVFRQHNREDLLSKSSPINYDPGATAPTWEKFISEIFITESGKPDPELIFFIRQLVGYSLSASTIEQGFFFAYGVGSNGKSTFFNVLSAILGDYYLKVSQELLTFSDKHGQKQPYELAEIPGKRFVIAPELDEGRRLAESQMKDLSGEDTVKARPIYGRPFDFTPVCKVWMYGNHKPEVRGTDYGIWRRFYMIPFNARITPERIDRHLTKKLIRELPGVFNWAVKGFQSWQENGLIVPAIVKQTVSQYRNELDRIQRYIDECCLVESSQRIKMQDLYDDYKKWCNENGEYPLGGTKFRNKLKEKGFYTESGKGNYTYWLGLSLTESRQDESTPPY